MQKAAVYALLLMTHCLSVAGQVDFSSIKICHDFNKELMRVAVGEYVVNIKNGRLSSFYAQDSTVIYEEEDRQLTLKGMLLNKYDSLSIQLVSNTIVFSSSYKTITVQEIRSEALDTSISVQLGPIAFPVLFHRGQLQNAWVSIGNKFVSIRLHRNDQSINWDIAIETNTNENVLFLVQLNGAPHFLTLHDDLNNVGVRLFSDKKNGVFNILQGLKKERGNLYGSDVNYRLRYSQHGVLKKNNWKLPLTCD